MSQAQAPGEQPGGAEKQYREALAAGKFMIQRCGECRKAVFYPRMICPHCGAGDLEWIEPSGRGQVYSTTVVRRKADAGGDYNVALVDLEEGVRMMSRVDGVAPDQVSIGMPVRARIVQDNGQPMVTFAQEGER